MSFPTRHITNWLDLIRFDKPTGTFLLLLPCYLGMGAAWARLAHLPPSAVQLTQMADPTLPVLFALGAFTMRSAGCIINDLWDRRIDVHVERTRHRPIASGAVSPPVALAWLFGHLALGLGVLLCLNPMCVPIALASMPLVILYPLAKRHTDCPQAVLGMCFNWGIFVGNAAVLGTVDLPTCQALYVSAIAWTVLYDTIYGFQDIKDDRRIGVRSFAIYLDGKKDDLVYAIGVIGFFAALAGMNSGQSAVYYFALAGALGYVSRGFHRLNEKDTAACGEFFKMNVRFGWMLVAAWFFGSAALMLARPADDSGEATLEEKPWQKIYFYENLETIRLYQKSFTSKFSRESDCSH